MVQRAASWKVAGPGRAAVVLRAEVAAVRTAIPPQKSRDDDDAHFLAPLADLVVADGVNRPVSPLNRRGGIRSGGGVAGKVGLARHHFIFVGNDTVVGFPGGFLRHL
jgi:hypothetical protein